MSKQSKSKSSMVLVDGIAMLPDKAVERALRLLGQGNAHAAYEICDLVLLSYPRHPRAAYLFGGRYLQLGDASRAHYYLEIAAAGLPLDVDVCMSLANALIELNRFNEAESPLKRALKSPARQAEAWFLLGRVYANGKHPAEAEKAYREAIAIDPNGASSAWTNLAQTLLERKAFTEAIAAARQALALSPNPLKALANLGGSLHLGGRSDEAFALLQRAKKEIGFRNAVEQWQLFLFAANSVASCDAMQVAIFHKELGEYINHSLSPRPIAEIFNRDPHRRLKIGFVSGDFRVHPVGYFLRNWLQYVDRHDFELCAYASQSEEDAVTAQLRPMFDNWFDVFSMSDASLAEKIRSDAVDILFDLSGHTKYNRLLVFASRAAPVQVSYLGYFATTGVREMDYILVNHDLVATGEEALYTENPWYLPGTYLCYSAPPVDVATAEAPCLKNGFMTFGSFANLSKVNKTVIETWAEILLRIPDSRLLIKSGPFADAPTVAEYLARFEALGIARERLQFEASAPHADYLAAHNRVDIVLDTFSYNGGTTTADSLWMGVPVLTVHGDRYVSHMAEAILKQADLSDWAAPDREAYIQTAQKWANMPNELSRLRSGLRERVARSPLCDARLFARQFSDAMRGMWQKWCADHATR